MNLKVEVVCIGEELLRGSVLNTNASFLSKELFSIGVKVSRQTVLSDEKILLFQGLKECFQRSDWILCTGGLGSTLDDVTKEVVARILELPETFEGSFVFPNTEGLEPGVCISWQGKKIILLPGVPGEMQSMTQEQVIPYLKKLLEFSHSDLHVQSIHFCLLLESEIDLLLREIGEKMPEIEWGIYPSHGQVSIVMTSKNLSSVTKAMKEIRQMFFSYEIVNEQGDLALALQELFLEKEKTLALAESCTGGFLAHLITSTPGSSGYFLGSFVTYANVLKKNILLVNEDTLNQYGAVSSPIVESMLSGVFQMSSADFGIAVSGIAGPSGGSKEKPIGTVFFALGERGGFLEVGSFQIKGGREKVISLTSYKLLAFLYRKIKYGISSV